MIESDRELSAMVQELWDNDVNRLKPGVDYKISLQVDRTQNLKHPHRTLNTSVILENVIQYSYWLPVQKFYHVTSWY